MQQHKYISTCIQSHIYIHIYNHRHTSIHTCTYTTAHNSFLRTYMLIYEQICDGKHYNLQCVEGVVSRCQRCNVTKKVRNYIFKPLFC